MKHGIEELLLKIIEVGLLRIRVLGFDGRARECAVEADHLHNIPTAIMLHSDALVKAYIDTDVPCLRSNCTWSLEEFAPLWQQLESALRGPENGPERAPPKAGDVG